MAGFGPQPESCMLVLFGHQFIDEALGFLGDTFRLLELSTPSADGLGAVPPQTELADDAFEQGPDIVLHRC